MKLYHLLIQLVLLQSITIFLSICAELLFHCLSGLHKSVQETNETSTDEAMVSILRL